MGGKLLPINKQIDKDSQKQALENSKKLKPIIKTVILCGRQNLSLRWHEDYGVFDTKIEPNKNEGNFRAILRARIESGDENLKKHFETCGKNATYISWSIQNQIIEAFNEIIIQKLVTKIYKAKCFSVLADETTDVSTVEQFSLCVRFVELMSNNEYKIVEQLLKFVPVQSTTGQNLADVLLETLNNVGIDLNCLRGQGYDGASSMSGQFKGVQAFISNIYPTAIYVHCVSHSLNLALSNAAEVVPIRNAFGIIQKIYTFFNTPKRQNVLQNNIETSTHNSNKTKLKQLCPTRWVERHDSVIIMKQMLLPVVAALEEIQSWNCTDSSSNAFLLLSGIRQSSFIISLLCAEKLLSYTLPISKILQSSDLDISEALNNVDGVVFVLREIRSNVENEFKIIFDEANEIANALELTITMPRLTKNQTKRCNVPAENEEEYYIHLRVLSYNKRKESFTRLKRHISKVDQMDYDWIDDYYLDHSVAEIKKMITTLENENSKVDQKYYDLMKNCRALSGEVYEVYVKRLINTGYRPLGEREWKIELKYTGKNYDVATIQALT